MKIRLRELRRIIREAVEGSNDDGLAACVRIFGDDIQVHVYSPDGLLQVMKDKDTSNWEYIEDIAMALHDAEVVTGHLSLKKRAGEACNDAMEVVGSAGPGIGKIIYGLGYALSPSGRLMPDRHSVSDSALGGWKKTSSRGRRRIPLDDITAPLDSRLTPDDPTDDCRLKTPLDKGGPNSVLDYAYEAEGWEKAMLDRMTARHDATMATALEIDPDETRKRLESAISTAGHWLFTAAIE